jgi:hypothetical protein
MVSARTPLPARADDRPNAGREQHRCDQQRRRDEQIAGSQAVSSRERSDAGPFDRTVDPPPCARATHAHDDEREAIDERPSTDRAPSGDREGDRSAQGRREQREQ